MASARRPRLSGLPLLALALLLALNWAPPLFGLVPPLGLVAGAQAQGAPSACQAVGNNWTSCDNAFVSDDAYAFANATREPAQFAGPSGTVSTGGLTAVGAATHHEATNEVTPNGNTDYVEADSADTTLEMNLSSVTDPQTGEGHILRFTAESLGGGASPERLNVDLYQNGTLIVNAFASYAVNRDAYQTYSYILLTTEADSITNYSLLRVRITVATLGGGEIIRVTQAEFEVPGLLIPGTPSDTAWSRFGLGLSPSDTVRSVEIGVEWYRISNAPILNVTVSWNGGLAWATNQTATNKSADDNVVEWLNFTSNTTGDAAALNDSNFRVRLGTNASGGRLDYVTVRVNYLDVILDVNLSASASSADPGDILTLNATVQNLGSGPAQNVLIEGIVDPNATYLSSVPWGDEVARIVRWSIPSLPSGASTSVEWTVRINVGTPDQASITSRARVEGEDSGGEAVPPAEAIDTVTVVQAPVFSPPPVMLDRNQAERGDEIEATVYYNNTGTGTARNAWLNWSLGGHFELVSLPPPFSITNTPDGFNVPLTDVTPGPHAVTARLRVLSGLQDGLPMGLQVSWEATDGNGNPLPDKVLDGVVQLLAPSVSLVLEVPIQRVAAGSTFQINVSIQNAGGGPGTGWLNLTLPAGFRYVADNGTFSVATIDGSVAWRITSIPAAGVIPLGIELQANGEPRIESVRLSLDYTDGKGTPFPTVWTPRIALEVFGEPIPAWLLWLALALPAGGGLLAFFLIRRRLRAFNIEEVFVIATSGILVAHLSRTLTPNKDRDILAGMLKAVQDFVMDAFSERDETPMRRIEFGRLSILIERGVHHWVAVVFQGKDHAALATRISMVSQQIAMDYGDVLESWTGDMSAVRGIRDLLEHLWPREGLSLRPITGFLSRLRELWPHREKAAEDPSVDTEEEAQDPAVAELLRR
ncbi:MAG: DUF11 domain-containing protein [Candidatus Thermoplasmatota archaeon]|nr:DUF11 domain-containing protein [Candidatus Thermoplasmatota archaeon]